MYVIGYFRLIDTDLLCRELYDVNILYIYTFIVIIFVFDIYIYIHINVNFTYAYIYTNQKPQQGCFDSGFFAGIPLFGSYFQTGT